MSVIAIDGTFASGKGTLAKKVASHYDLPYLDTGKLYRAVAFLVSEAGGDPSNIALAIEMVGKITSELLADPVLKGSEIAANASRVAVHPELRVALLDHQRDFAKIGAVLDGRDIGTVICPDADVKLYIDAEPEERARRRYKELKGYGEDVTYEEVLGQLRERDSRDKDRQTAPLRPAVDAYLLDTTNLSIERAFEVACNIIDAAMEMSVLEIKNR